MWQCAKCGVEKPATVHQKRQTYCSRVCMADAYSTRLLGAANPNYRAASKKQCLRCGKDFERFGPQAKYCSHFCYAKHNAKQRTRQASLRLPKPAAPPKPRPPSCKVSRECDQCGSVFTHFPSAKRQFCSYKCYLDSGGALRAGRAAAKATMRYGSKKDANHKELMEAMRALVPVFDMSSYGFGVPDGVAWCLNETWQFFDIKNPKTGYGRRGLNEVQRKWLGRRRAGPVFLLYTVDDAIRFARGEFDGLKFEVGSTDAMNL